jgi:DNA-binding XRE family transcriptional regulator
MKLPGGEVQSGNLWKRYPKPRSWKFLMLLVSSSKSNHWQREFRKSKIMPWKDVSMESLAKSLGVNFAEVREKQWLIELIVKVRKARSLSQAALAKRIGVSQSRIAQIESGVGTARVSFDVLLNILVELGYEFRVIAKKTA